MAAILRIEHNDCTSISATATATASGDVDTNKTLSIRTRNDRPLEYLKQHRAAMQRSGNTQQVWFSEKPATNLRTRFCTCSIEKRTSRAYLVPWPHFEECTVESSPGTDYFTLDVPYSDEV